MSMVVRCLDQVNERALALRERVCRAGVPSQKKFLPQSGIPASALAKAKPTRLQYSLLDFRSFGRIIVQPIASVGEIRLARGDQNGRHAPCRTPHSDAVSAAAIGSSSQTIRQMRVSSLAPTAVLG